MRFRENLPNARIIATLGVIVVLGLLIARTTNSWQGFDWQAFYNHVRYVSVWRSIGALAFIYAGFWLRAVRWRLFLRPMKDIRTARLFGPTVVGFAGLAVLGHPGELIRPCLIARKENLSVSSQLAALALERVFDIVAAGALISAALLASSQSQLSPVVLQFRRGGMLLIGLIAVVAVFLLLLARQGEQIGSLVQRLLSPVTNRLAHRVAGVTKSFGANLNLILDSRSLVLIGVLSIAIWFSIALAYLESLHAFGALRSMSLVQALLLMGFALLGSLVRLPGAGAQQLVVIAALVGVFSVPAELAASCGILMWLTLIMAPVPVGLALTWEERKSLGLTGTRWSHIGEAFNAPLRDNAGLGAPHETGRES